MHEIVLIMIFNVMEPEFWKYSTRDEDIHINCQDFQLISFTVDFAPSTWNFSKWDLKWRLYKEFW